MPTIQIKNMSFTYNGSYYPVFDQVTFNMDTSWKLGITGRNGRGKTTFMKLLLGHGPSLGTLTGRIDHQTAFDYFPSEQPSQLEDPSLLTYEWVEALYPQYEHWALVKELNMLDIDEGVLYRAYSSLSHGERTKVQLALLFLKDNHFLLIDEPTNHLDIMGRTCVAKYLSKKQGFILISHDRNFLDACIDHVLSINKTQIDIHQGDFSTYLQNKGRQDAFEIAENEKLTKSIGVLGDAIRRTRGWSDDLEATKCGNGHVDRGYIGAKSEKMMKRAMAIEQRRLRAIDEKKQLLHNVEANQPLELKVIQPGWAYRASQKPMIQVANLEIAYPGRLPVLSDFTLDIHWGDRIAISGGNGCGKSSLLKVLAASSQAKGQLGQLCYSGIVNRDASHLVSLVSQDTSDLRGRLPDFIKVRNLDMGLFNSMLHKLDFSTDHFEKPIEELSAGQKKKLLLAASICDRAHIYIWDEPLNYIDVISRMQIEDMILKYTPTLIFVEHDVTFTERVATRRVVLGHI